MKITYAIKRKLLQFIAFGCSNAHLLNFKGGKIYTGKWKQFCNPGLNCYSCPAGTLEGGLFLLAAHESLRKAIGALFSLKMAILVLTLISCVFFYRFFCRTLCPLGAIYGLFNKISMFHLEVDSHKCVGCGKCKAACGMEVDPVKTPDSPECIRCGACVDVCPADALRLGFSTKCKKNLPLW